MRPIISTALLVFLVSSFPAPLLAVPPYQAESEDGTVLPFGGEEGGEEPQGTPSEQVVLEQGSDPHKELNADGSDPVTQPIGPAEKIPSLHDESRGGAPEVIPVIFGGIVANEDLAGAAAGIEAMLVTRIEERGRLEIIRKWDLGRLLDNEAERLVAGCTENCGDLIELLDALGAPLLLVGELHRVAGQHLLTLTLLETRTAAVRARASREARSERQLLRGLADQAWELVKQARLDRGELGPSGMGMPRFHLALKAGNSLATVASDLVSGRLHGGRLNIEGSYYATPSVLIFLELGAGLGRVRDADTNGVLDLDIVPAGLGIKKLWTFPKLRIWAGGSLGAGVLGLFLGGSNDLATALATTAVLGMDYRLGPRWTVLLEGSTSLTDALLDPARNQDLNMPILASVTLGAALLFP